MYRRPYLHCTNIFAYFIHSFSHFLQVFVWLYICLVKGQNTLQQPPITDILVKATLINNCLTKIYTKLNFNPVTNKQTRLSIVSTHDYSEVGINLTMFIRHDTNAQRIWDSFVVNKRGIKPRNYFLPLPVS